MKTTIPIQRPILIAALLVTARMFLPCAHAQQSQADLVDGQLLQTREKSSSENQERPRDLSRSPERFKVDALETNE